MPISTELLLVSGVVLGMLSLVAWLSALIEKRPPRAAAIAVVVSGSLFLLAVSRGEGSFDLIDIPNAFVVVVASLIK